MSIIKNVQMIDVNDWDDLVRSTYNRPYCFQQQDGCKERGIYTLVVPTSKIDVEEFENEQIPEEVNGEIMGVTFAAWIARNPEQSLNSKDQFDREHGLKWFYLRNFYPSIESVAFDLYKKGLLPSGEYIINIDW